MNSVQTRWNLSFYDPILVAGSCNGKITLKTKVLMQLRKRPASACAEIGPEVHATNNQVALAVSNLLREKKITRTDGLPYRYSLV